MARDSKIELDKDWKLFFDGSVYKLDTDRFSTKDVFIHNFSDGFCCLPLPCKRDSFFSNSNITLFFYNDKKSFSAFKKSKLGKMHEEICKRAIYTKIDISMLRSNLISQAKSLLRNISWKDFTCYYDTIDDIFLTLESGGPCGADSTLTIDNGEGSVKYTFGSNHDCIVDFADYRGLWDVQYIKYPFKVVSSGECKEREIAYVMIRNNLFLGGTEKQVLDFMSACLIGYQQTHGELYEETDFVKACKALYCEFWKSDNKVFVVYQSIYEIGAIIRDLFNNISEGWGCSERVALPVIKDNVQQKTEAEKKQDAGQAGEATVEYALKWLKGKGFQSVGNRIRLKNEAFIDEAQEYDHILVFPGGIVCIETKNFGGKITITESGQWIKERGGERRGMENPVFQVDRHHNLLSSIVGDIPIYDVICVANQNCELIGAEYSPIPVVKYDMLQRHLMGLPNKAQLNKEQMQEVIQTIKQHKIHSQDKD